MEPDVIRRVGNITSMLHVRLFSSGGRWSIK